MHQYELIRELGRGGMGAVFLARDLKLGRRVAVKFLHSDQPGFNERFLIEAQATARCSHENIVIIHEIGAFRGNSFMVLEYLQGSSLSEHLREHPPLSPGRAVEIMVPVVRALACAHAADIVHRDLKPDNIFLSDSGAVKVLDFGIAKVVQQGAVARPPMVGAQAALAHAQALSAGGSEITGSTELTQHGAMVGTMPYMAPEQWLGEGVDARTDIWAVGILLFRMLTGLHPLHPLRGQQLVVTAMLDQPMPLAREKAPDIPEPLAEVIDCCLQKNKDGRFTSARALLDALEPLLPGRFGRPLLRTNQSPYTGLSAFQESDADRFFGRATDIAALATRLRDQPLIGVVGPSGVGKSSFIRAGVVPALKQSGEEWETMVVRPGRNPIGALAAALAPILVAGRGSSGTGTGSLSGASGVSGTAGVTGTTGPTGALRSQISGITGSIADDMSVQEAAETRLATEPGFLGHALRHRARRLGRKLLLFIDQFEELYTLVADPEQRLAFTRCLTGVADDATAPLRLVLSIRSDFLDRAGEDRDFLQELTKGLYFLMPPSREGMRDALIQPAELAGYRFEEPAIVEHMLDTLQDTPGALPLLQFTASKLWEARDTSRQMLTDASYRAMGGITGALASHADQILTELPTREQRLVRAIFLQLVTPERTRAIVSVSELHELSRDADEVQRVLDRLVQARLLVVQTASDAGGGAGASSVEIVHESLLHTWPRLRHWLDENQDDAAFLEQLRTAARQWQARGRPSGLLWRGEAADEAQRFAKRFRAQLPQAQTEYLSAVLSLRTRAGRLRRVVVAIVVVVSLGVAVAASVALVRIQVSEQQAQYAARDARAAEQRAEQRSAALQASMLEQRKAEAKARAEAERAEAARAEAEASREELASANSDLVAALDNAEKARRRARRASRRAQRNEEEARRAEDASHRAQRELEIILARERARVARLQERLGSEPFETLD
ncbi:serine/threonine-protein kinase [Haliangium ochraceum]|nr:serine/threonine-protein kinase [Haliangium ochraceum]